MRRQAPAELLGELDAHRLLPFDAIRLAQRRDVEVAALRRERARLLARVADVPLHQLQVGAERADRVENRLGRRLRRVDAHGQSGRGARTRVSAAPALPAVGTTNPGTPRPRARVTAALMPRALNDAVGLSPSSFTQSRATPISRASFGQLVHRREPFAERDRRLRRRLSGMHGGVPPHVPARASSRRAAAWANRRRTRNGCPHVGQTVARASPDSRVVARRTFEMPGAHVMSDRVVGGVADCLRFG